MGYTIAGTYVVDCSCRQVCPCAVDGTPTGPEDQCWAGAVFHIEKGKLDDVELSGVDFGFEGHIPGNLTGGNWKMGVVVDQGATDEQADAIGKIMKGEAGGPFAEFAPLIADFSLRRARVTFSDGDKPRASIEGVGDLTFEPTLGPDGNPTIFRNAPLAFAPDVKLGKSSGQLTVHGRTVDLDHAESAEFEYSSEGPSEVRPRA